MIDKQLESITAGDLESLVFNRTTERRDLEFKQTLPGRTDAEVKEFIDDVVSLANAQGGDLIFGIAEEDGEARDVCGIELANRDAEISRLENILRDAVEPRLTVQPHWVPLGVNRGVLILRVPASLAFPHRRNFRGSSRFCSRNSTGKYEMDVHELRQAFTQSEQLPRRFRELHEQALRNARGEEMPFALSDDPTAVVTVAPLALFREERDLPITPETAILPPKAEGDLNILRTLEGVLVGTAVKDRGLRAYVLTHRRGYLDAAWTIGGTRDWFGNGEKKIVWPKSFEEGLTGLARAIAARLLQFGLGGPWVVLVTVFGVHGFELMRDKNFASPPAWRTGATFPALVTDNVNADALEPIFRSLWLLFGEERPSPLSSPDVGSQ